MFRVTDILALCVPRLQNEQDGDHVNQKNSIARITLTLITNHRQRLAKDHHARHGVVRACQHAPHQTRYELLREQARVEPLALDEVEVEAAAMRETAVLRAHAWLTIMNAGIIE